MITPKDIRSRAERHYPRFLDAWLAGEPFTPLRIAVGKPPADFRALQSAVDALHAAAKPARGYGYELEVQTTRTRDLGTQSLPKYVIIPTSDDLLRLCDKRAEFVAFQADVATIRATLPSLEAWLRANPKAVIANHGIWPELLLVCQYFLANPRPERYARELPISVHTKFIETNEPILRMLFEALLPSEALKADVKDFAPRYGLRSKEPLIRLRWLDRVLCPTPPLYEVSAPLSQVAQLPNRAAHCLIVENELVFLTLPPLAGTVAIFGGGFGLGTLHALPWLHACQLWYWGDIDTQGFDILNLLRASFPATRALLMDRPTLDRFAQFVVAGTPQKPATFAHLTPEEQALFDDLRAENRRLEQERIDHAYASALLTSHIQAQ